MKSEYRGGTNHVSEHCEWGEAECWWTELGLWDIRVSFSSVMALDILLGFIKHRACQTSCITFFSWYMQQREERGNTCVCVQCVRPHLAETGGKITVRGCAVRTSSPLTASIIRFWKVLSKIASLMTSGTRWACSVLCVGAAFPEHPAVPSLSTVLRSSFDFALVFFVGHTGEHWEDRGGLEAKVTRLSTKAESSSMLLEKTEEDTKTLSHYVTD